MLPFFVAVLVFSPSEPDPLDGFHGNYQAIRAALTFTYHRGYCKTSEVGEGRAWHSSTISLTDEQKKQYVSGVWEFDGRSQRILNRPLEELIPLMEDEIKRTRRTTIMAPIEVVFDSELTASHPIGFRTASVGPASANNSHLKFVKGPFSWGSLKFPEVIHEKWGEAQRAIHDAKHGGFATKDIVYSKSKKDWDYTLAVALDPHVGFLPRFSRTLSLNTQKDEADVREMYLLRAERCTSGAFVPVEWIELMFTVEKFARTYPLANNLTTIKPPNENVLVGWFRATALSDLSSEPRLEAEEGFVNLGTQAEVVPLGDNPTVLGMSRIRQLVGLKVYATPPLPTINTSEAHQFEHAVVRPWRQRILIAVFLTFGFFLILLGWRRLRRSRHFFVFALAFVISCKAEQPVPRLEASFVNQNILSSPDSPHEVLPLRVRNTGNCDLVLEDLKAGCTCMVLDESIFPRSLKPLEEFEIQVRIQKKQQFAPLKLGWTFITDHGELQCNSRVFIFPSVQLSPSLQSYPVLYEGETHNFSLVAHQIMKEEDTWENATLQVDDGLRVAIDGEKAGNGPVQGFRFREVNYKLTVEDATLGDHRKEVQLVDDSGISLAHAFVLWHRTPAVTTVPQKVYLADRPVRVFMRARDDEFEFIRIVEAPPGVDVIITSRREVTVTPSKHAPTKISGETVVETNKPIASFDPVVRIPVVRYVSDHESTSQIGEQTTHSIGSQRSLPNGELQSNNEKPN